MKKIKLMVCGLLVALLLSSFFPTVTVLAEDIIAAEPGNDKGKIPVVFMYYDEVVYKTTVYGQPGEITTKRKIYDFFKTHKPSDLRGYTFTDAANGGQPIKFPPASVEIPDTKAIQIMVVLDGTPLLSKSRIDLIFYTYGTTETFGEDQKKADRKTKVVDRQTVEGNPGDFLAEDIGAWLEEEAYTVIDGDKYAVERIEGTTIFPDPADKAIGDLHVYLERIGPASEEDLLRKEDKRTQSMAVFYLVDQKDMTNPLGGVTALGQAGNIIDTVELSQELKRDLSYRKILKNYEYMKTLDRDYGHIDQDAVVYPPPDEEGVAYIMVFKSKGFKRSERDVGKILWPTPFTGDRSPVATGVLLSTLSLVLLAFIQKKKTN